MRLFPNGGFLSVVPDRAVLDDLVRLTRETPFVGGRGWNASDIGYYYGGIGPQGLLSFYFFEVLMDRALRGKKRADVDISGANVKRLWPRGRAFLELDQCVYNA